MSHEKTIFITGAAAGIGRQTARLFHDRGYAVGLYDIDERGVQGVAMELGARCAFGKLDVTDALAFAQTVAGFYEQFERFDVLLNNAGILRMGRFDEVPLEMHALTIDVNVKGVINGIAAALPYLRATAHAQGRAHIITMCSAASIYGTPEHSTYSASKSAVRALTEALSLELAPESIIVSDVLPGYVDTDMVRRQPHPSALVQRVGVSHTTVDIAELIWASASGTRLHRFGNWSLNISDRLARALPGVTRRIIARMQ